MSKLLSTGRALSLVFAMTAAAGCNDDVTDLSPEDIDHNPVGASPLVHDHTWTPDAGATDAMTGTAPPVTEPDAQLSAQPDAGSDDHGGDAHTGGEHDAGDDHGGDDHDGGVVDAYVPPVADGSFGSVFAVLSVSCVGCHGAGKPLDLSTLDSAYASLVNVPASMKACAASDGGVPWVRVVPGDLEQSLMIQKLEGHAPCGNPMPTKGVLPDTTVEVFRAWVSAGAPAL